MIRFILERKLKKNSNRKRKKDLNIELEDLLNCNSKGGQGPPKAMII